MHKLTLIILLFLFATNIWSQEVIEQKKDSILIYSAGDGFLQPFIENSIKNLKNKKTNENYFNDVNSINTFVKDSEFKGIMTDLISSNKPQDAILGYSYTEKQIKTKEEIFLALTSYDLFLSVRTNTLGELIEFQFQLFNTNKSNLNDGSTNFPLNISNDIIGVENFFINPKTEGYLTLVENALYRLFDNSNSAPIAKLIVNNITVKNGDTLNIETKNKIYFNGQNSFDLDTENIKYFYRSIPSIGETPQQFEGLPFIDNRASQEIVIDRSGIYKTNFFVDDGISNSNIITFYILAKNQPSKLDIDKNETISVRERTFFDMSLKDEKGLVYMNSGDGSDSIYISRNLLKSKRQKNINKNNIQIVPKQFDSIRQQHFFDLNSKFDGREFQEEINYYLYDYASKDSLFSNPIKHIHKIKTRTPISFYAEIGPATSNSYGDSLTFENTNLKVNGDIRLSLNIGLLAHFTKNLKVGLDVNTFGWNDEKKISRDGFYIEHPGALGFYSYYLFNGDRIRPYIGLEWRSGGLKSTTPDNENRIFKNGGLAGFKAGIHYPISRRKLFDGDLRINASHLWFLDKDFRDIVSFNLNIGYIVSF